MTEHDTALAYFQWLHNYCNKHYRKNNCQNCIFGNQIQYNNQPYFECRLTEIATGQITYNLSLNETIIQKEKIENTTK